MRWIAVAIVVGSALIGLGIYLGLRRPEGQDRPRSVPVKHADVAQVRDQATTALRAAGATCGHVRVSVDLTIGPRGEEIARGITELRDDPQPATAACLRALPPIRIAPPGETVRLAIDLVVP